MNVLWELPFNFLGYITNTGIPSWNQMQLIAFGSHDSVAPNCDVTSLI